MNEKKELPQTADEVGEFMDNLVFEELPTSQDEADTLASLPAGSEVMVVRSVRLPMELDQAVTEAAKAAAVPKSTWVRQAIEVALATQADQDEPISRADALRALTPTDNSPRRLTVVPRRGTRLKVALPRRRSPAPGDRADVRASI